MLNRTIKGKENVSTPAIYIYAHTGTVEKRGKLRGQTLPFPEKAAFSTSPGPFTSLRKHPTQPAPPVELVIRIAIQIHLSGPLALQFYYCFMKL